MFNFTDALVIFSLFLVFMATVGGSMQIKESFDSIVQESASIAISHMLSGASRDNI